MPGTTCRGHADAGGKKTAETIRQQVEGEVNALLRLVFEEQRKTGRLDLEAVEMAMRAAMHRAGAGALSQLLRGHPPGPDEREIPCPCGYQAPAGTRLVTGRCVPGAC